MIKKILLSGFSLAITFILVSAINKPNSGGAPSASTGAPSEQTCAMSTCHDDNGVNIGTAKLSIEAPDSIGLNEEVTLKVSLEDVDKIRFGFQVTALDQNNKMVGEFIVTDDERTQVLGDNSNFPDRKYLTYTYMGTLSKAGGAQWEAKWKPTNYTGKVTFYVAGISANNNGNDKGDFTYTTSKAVKVGSFSARNSEKIHQESVRVSISNQELTISNPNFANIKNISITDINGKVILNQEVNQSNAYSTLVLPEFTKGILIVNLITTTGKITQKLFATHD